jgi:hypothetical protein
MSVKIFSDGIEQGNSLTICSVIGIVVGLKKRRTGVYGTDLD